MSTKACSCCRRNLPLDQFGRNRQTPDGRSYYCKTCARDKHAEWVRNNPERVRAANNRYVTRQRVTNTLQDGHDTSG